MNQAEMLHEMCHEVLAEADVKAICKSRGVPNQAASRQLLENLFVSGAGAAAAMRQLDRIEIALLHLLRGYDNPVDIAFFSRLDPPRRERWFHGTLTQRLQGVFSKVKDRLVRRGVLLWVLGPESWPKKTKMERWQFALPEQLARHLPPLVESAKRLNADGDWLRDVARNKLITAVGEGADSNSKKDDVGIVSGELRWSGQPFQVDRVVEWQKLQWRAETDPKKSRKEANPYTMPPAEAVLRILAGLDPGLWSDADALAAPLEVFCGSPVDAQSICESGYRWGFVARQEAEGRPWYRPAPLSAAADAPPDRYLAAQGDEGVIVNLDVVPFEALETLVLISDQRPVRGTRPRLLVAPNLVKLGRTAEIVAALPLVDWLQKNSRAFHQSFETVRQRRGKTILHENLSVARVCDLSLRIALEKTLGRRIVLLGEEFIAFPTEAFAEVKRVVVQMGHVVKEVSHPEP